MPAVWILSRFEHDRTGTRFPGKAAKALAAAFESGGRAASHLDPLDAWFTAASGFRRFHLESGDREKPVSAVFWTDPYRPDADAHFCEALEASGAKCMNGSPALSAFSDPLEPFVRLSGAGIRVEAAARVRRPHCSDDLIAAIGAPLDLFLIQRDGKFAKMRIPDRGSLRGMLDHMWRSDIGAVAVKALEKGEYEEWVSVAGGKAFGAAGAEALAAAKALSLDFGCILVRGEGAAARIAAARPFPAPPGALPGLEVMEAVAGSTGRPV